MQQQVHVLHVLGRAGIGGVETFVRQVVSTIDREQFVISVCVIGKEGELSDHLRNLDIPVLCLDSPELGLGAMTRFHRWVRAQRPHVLHASVGGGRVRWLARFAGCSGIVCHVHGPPDELAVSVQERDPRLRSTVLRTYGSGSDRVLTCSAWLGSSLSAIAPELAGRIHTLHNAVDADAVPFGPAVRRNVRSVLGMPTNAPVLGFVGRFVQQKGIEELAIVAREWLEREPEGRFLAIGDGPLRPQLDALGSRFAGRVHMSGQRLDASALIAAMDVMVLTSRWEAFGIVNLEAMAAAVPVVAFDVDGVSEVIRHDQTGLLVPRGDVDAMTAAVCALMESPARRASMGVAGRQRVCQEFSLRRMVATLCGHYRQVLHNSPDSRPTAFCS